MTRPAAVLLLLVAALAVPPSASAQVPEATTFLTPFPDRDRYRVQVLGDAMATGLAEGLAEVMADEPRFQIEKRSRTLQGLLRVDLDEEAKSLDARLQAEPAHIVVVMLGIEDRVPLRRANRRLAIGSDEWKAEYTRRIDVLTRGLRKRSAAVFWLGLPIMRRDDVNEDAEALNELFRARALANGARYVDISSSFTDGDQGYATHGPDISGKTRVLREGDGIHFSWHGYRKLAYFVQRELKRAAQQAWDERTIPLAGSETEQARIRPGGAVKLAPFPLAPGRPGTGPLSSGPQARSQPATSPSGGLAAESSRITLKSLGAQGREEAVSVEIVRPAIPAAVVALVTRREAADKPSQLGDPIMTEIFGGLTVVSSVTPLAETSADRRRGAAAASSPLHRVLQLGETLPPKPGRSDDLPWPRPEPVVPKLGAEGSPALTTGSAPARASPSVNGVPIPRRPSWARSEGPG
jgi:hypothetical protein